MASALLLRSFKVTETDFKGAGICFNSYCCQHVSERVYQKLSSQLELLAISTIERLTTQFGELAYLSACSTAELTFSNHIDEAINLANCFQVLGFRHVIGTIWSASDHSAGVTTQKFYTRLARQITATGPEPAKGDGSDLDVARPLHEAVQEYMKECTGEEAPLHWAPWIHVGA